MNTFESAVLCALARARKNHKALNSAHEAYAVILEELDEFKAEVWKKSEDRSKALMLLELIDVAAMCQRAAEDLGLIPYIPEPGDAT